MNNGNVRAEGRRQWGRIVLLGCVLAVAIGLGACAGDDGSGAEDVEPVIGLNTTLTGPLSQLGRDWREGAELAVDVVNADGGIDGEDLELIVEDNKLDTGETVRVARDMLPKVAALLTGVTGTQLLAVAPLAEEAEVPLLAPSISTVSITEQGYKWTFRTQLNDTVAVQAIAKYLAEETDAERVAVIYDQADFGSSAAEKTPPALEGEGLKVSTEQSFQSDDSDFSAQITHVLNQKSDAVILWAVADAAARITRQLRQRGFDGLITGATNNGIAEFSEPAGKFAEGVLFFVPFFETAHENAEDFVERYEQEFGRPPNISAALSYDSVMFLADAMREVGTSNEAIADYLRSNEHDGVTGAFSFAEDGDSIRHEIYVGRWSNGEKELLTTYDAEDLGGR